MIDKALLENVPEDVESVARAICVADGCDPEQRAVGIGGCMPSGYEYPLWKARIPQAMAALTRAREIFLVETVEQRHELYGRRAAEQIRQMGEDQ